MPRYYDMDKLSAMIQAKADTLIGEGKTAFLYVAKWLDLLPTADVVPKSEWISVEERSPKRREKCLCYYPQKDYGSKVVVDYAETDDGYFAEQYQFGAPSHWMPLPEPPKMKGE